MRKCAPVALFTYVRPEHIRKTVEALASNELAEQTELYIFSDAPRSEKDAVAVAAVREYLRGIQVFASVNLVERSRNYGLADSIVDGVTSVLERHGKVIVLEDDIVTSPYFLRYMNDALNLYENEERVMHIAAHMLPIKFPEGVTESFFLRQSSCWGWGTWQRSWRHFHRNGDVFINTFRQEDIKRFNLDGAYDYWSQLLANHDGSLKTWAVYWYACIFSRGGLCLHPRTSMVNNIGFDGSGDNCGVDDNWRTGVALHPLTQFPVGYVEDKVAIETIGNAICGNVRKHGFVGRFAEKIRDCFTR